MYQFTKKYPKKRAFITGAGSGLGKAFTLALAKEGWTIGITDISESRVAEMKQAIQQAGGKAIPYVFDVSDRAAYEGIAKEFLGEVGGIDLLINNAGVGDGGPFADYKLDYWEWMVGINQMGVIYGCHFFVPTFKQQKGGHIINVSSAASFAAAPNMSAYNTTKAAVKALSETLYLELKEDNVGVSVLMPTFFKTNIMEHSKGSDDEGREMAHYLMETADITADEVADTTLQKAANGQLHIVLPNQARFLYRIKRFLPSLYFKMNYKMFKDQDKMKAKLKKKYEQKMKQKRNG